MSPAAAPLAIGIVPEATGSAAAVDAVSLSQPANNRSAANVAIPEVSTGQAVPADRPQRPIAGLVVDQIFHDDATDWWATHGSRKSRAGRRVD